MWVVQILNSHPDLQANRNDTDFKWRVTKLVQTFSKVYRNNEYDDFTDNNYYWRCDFNWNL